MVLENTFIQIFVSGFESMFHTSMLIIVVFQNMMLLAQWTSCLKDNHTNLQYIGNGISYFGASTILYAKTNTRNIKSICLKDSHTNYSNNVGLSIWYFGISLQWYTKNDAASSMNELFKKHSYIFSKIHRNWYYILLRLYSIVYQNDAASSMN